MPSADGIFATIAGNLLFAKLDHNEAHTQLVLADESQMLVSAKTHKELITIVRLPYCTSASS